MATKKQPIKEVSTLETRPPAPANETKGPEFDPGKFSDTLGAGIGKLASYIEARVAGKQPIHERLVFARTHLERALKELKEVSEAWKKAGV